MKYAILFFLVAFGFQLKAQDIIYKKDGQKIEAKIVLVNETQIKYKRFSNLEGPEYLIGISKVSTIVFENGDHQVFDQARSVESSVQAQRRDEGTLEYGKNIISLNYFDVISKKITISYERIFNDGNIGIRIPFSYKFNQNDNFNVFNKVKLKTGIDLNFYISRKQRSRYFLGPSIRVRREIESDLFSASFTPEEYTSIGGYINNGVAIQMNQTFNMSFLLGLGLKNAQLLSNDEIGRQVLPSVYIEGNFGVRF